MKRNRETVRHGKADDGLINRVNGTRHRARRRRITKAAGVSPDRLHMRTLFERGLLIAHRLVIVIFHDHVMRAALDDGSRAYQREPRLLLQLLDGECAAVAHG